MKLLARAIAIASKAHENQLDKGGKPYILHCLWVMDRVRHLGENYMIVAVLHDLIEDTPWTIEDLEKEGFNWEIIQNLQLLTHKSEDTYETYIENIAVSKIAREVKMRDLEHNSKITRLKGLRQSDIQRLYKYNKSYTKLKNFNNNN